jgi:two-component system, NtrC family, response regulator GlrR
MSADDQDATENLDGKLPHLLVRRFRVTALEGPDAGATATSSNDGTLAIGLHESAGLVLTDRTVSRFHCELAIVDGQARVRDLGSRNGTTVDGVQVMEAFVRDGAVLAVGRTRVQFQLGDDHGRVPLSAHERFGAMVGRSPVMRATFALLEQAAQVGSTVLLQGETGTGKELAAEGIHRESSRAAGPLVAVDCSAIPGELLESELFGHERGAFTGAVSERKGAFAEADGGTIFLDEIGELPPELQPKLLGVLERREVKRVGASRAAPIDVRVIAATNRGLRAEVNAGRFRADLYYRLAVLEVRLPPLRERLDDLPLLVDELLAQVGALDRPERARLCSADGLAELARHSWPGNVRELRNYVERCLAFRVHVAPGETVELAAAVTAPAPTWRAARAEFERRFIEATLRANEGNVTAAARAAGIDRIHFYRLLWRYGLR